MLNFSRVRWLAFWSLCLIVPFGVAIAFLLLASLMPIRLDYRNFQDQRRAESLRLPHGVPYVFLSTNAATPARHFFLYAVPTLAFPSTNICWVVSDEAPPGEGPVGARIDAEGTVRRRDGSKISLAAYAAEGVVLYETPEARLQMEAVAPVLKSARAARVIDPSQTSPITARTIANEITPVRLIRIAAVSGVVAALAGVLFPLFAGSRNATVAATAAGGVIGPVVLIWFCYWAQWLPFSAPGAWPFIAWGFCAFALLNILARGETDIVSAVLAAVRRNRLKAVVLALIALGLCATYLLRLDFDEDAHCHWLLMARSYFSRGKHAPELLTQHVSAASYPFAYGVFLALSGWIADSKPSTFMTIGPDSAVAVLAYRMMVTGLNLGVLALLHWTLSILGRGDWRYAVACAGTALCAFPVLQGHHSAADQLLFPVLASAILLINAGGRSRTPGLLSVGAFMAASSTFIRIEGGLLAALLWKVSLSVTNTNFNAPLAAQVLRGSGTLLQLWGSAGVILLREGWLPLLVGVLPSVWLWVVLRDQRLVDRFRASLVPVGTYACVVGFPAIYLFSTADQLWHLRVSYARVLMMPMFSAFVYLMVALGSERARDHDKRL